MRLGRHHLGHLNTLLRLGASPGYPVILNPLSRASASYVRRFQAGEVDWHDLAPEIESHSDVARRLRDDRTVAALQGFKLSQRDYGPLGKLEACGDISDACMIHGSVRECVEDELCGWCGSKGVCVDRLATLARRGVAEEHVRVCKEALVVAKEKEEEGGVRGGWVKLGTVGGIETAQPSECVVRASRSRLFSVEVSGNNQMFYHFSRELLPGVLGRAGSALDTFRAHMYLHGSHVDDSPFAREALTSFTNSCPLRHPLPPGICFSSTPPTATHENLELSGWYCEAEEVEDGAEVKVEGLWVGGRGYQVVHPSKCRVVDVPNGVQLESVEEAVALGYRIGPSTSSYSVSSIGHTNSLAWTHEPSSLPPWPPVGPDLPLHTSSNPTISLPSSWSGGAHPSHFLIAAMGLEYIVPPISPQAASHDHEDVHPEGTHVRPRVGFISRMNKRLLLNEAELVIALRRRGFDVEVLHLELLPLYEQIRMFRSLNVLVGVHGSGLSNTMFMHPGTSVVQIVPYHVTGAASFFQPTAAANQVKYYEITPTEREETTPHFHFLSKLHQGHVEEDLERGPQSGQSATFFSFWINQDTSINPEALADTVSKAYQPQQQ